MGYVRNVPQQWSRFVKCAMLILGSVLIASICRAQAAPESQSRPSGWADELNEKYPGLLNEFGQLFDKLQKNVQFPAARGESRILPVLPESTIAYGAIPNYGDTSHQALKIFQQELQDSKVLNDWWKHGDMATEETKAGGFTGEILSGEPVPWEMKSYYQRRWMEKSRAC